MTIAIIGGLIVVGLSYSQDSTSTVQLVITIVSIRGISWLAKKITESVNMDCSQIINFAGWSLAGISIVKLLLNAKMGIEPALEKLGVFNQGLVNVGGTLSNLAMIADKITFWN